MTRARWTILARADLATIDDYWRQGDPVLADRIGRDAIAAGDFLVEFPGAGPTIDGAQRKWRVPSTPYLLIYRSVPSGVQILRIFHDRQNWLSPR